MIGLLTGWGVSQWVAKLIAYVAVPLLILAALYVALDAYGDNRYRAGVADNDAIWKAANDKVVKAAAAGTEKADRAELPRVIDQAVKVEEEKEKIDAATANGSSPFDVLFPGGGGV